MKRWQKKEGQETGDKEKEDMKKEILDRCEAFVEEWKRVADDFLKEGSKSMALYNEVFGLYY